MAALLEQLAGELALDEIQELDLSADVCQSRYGWEALPDLAPLGALCSLQKLTLTGWQLDSLAVLPPLPSLETLDVSDNELDALEGLPRFPHLKALYVSNNLLRHLAGLESCKNLRELHADRNELRDVSALEQCQQLEYLHLANNPALRTPEPLTQLPTLRFLNLMKVLLPSLVFLEPLTALTELHITAAVGLSLAPLERLELQVLGLGCQGLQQLELPSLDSVELLILRNASGLEALPDLSCWGRLRELRLEGAGVRHIHAAQLPASLRQLKLKGATAVSTRAEWALLLPPEIEITD